MGHAERAHALLSASGAHRWLVCTPSAKLEEQFPDSTSEAAKEGTLAHELAELKVRHYFYTTDFGRKKYTTRVNKLKKEDLWKDEMERYTDEYLDVLRVTALGLGAPPYVAIEQRMDLSDWIPEGFGTADCVMVYGGTVHVFDFKYGKGVQVDAEQNPQMMLYALGAYRAYKMLYPIAQIKMTIIQPRIDHISEWTCTLEELLTFGEEARSKAMLAMEGKGDYHPDEKACRFCRAKAQCRARSDHNVKKAFNIGELPPLISAEEAGKRLLELQDVVKYQKDLQDWALSECLAGKDVPGWKAVEGRSTRDWTDMDDAFDKLIKTGITPEEMLYEKKPLTLAQVEKLIGKKEFQDTVGEFVVKKSGKPTLVKESDKREAITNRVTAEQAFEEEK